MSLLRKENQDLRRRLEEAESALRALQSVDVGSSEEHHRLLVETLLQGVVYQDTEGKIVSMNSAAEHILGKTREEFLGSSPMREERGTIREDGSPFPGTEHPAMVALRTGNPVRAVTMGVFNPRENAVRWISVDAVPLFRPGASRPHEVYTLFADITERKRIEQAQSEANRQLAEAHERKDDFLATLSHELRNPLAPIKNSIYILERASPGSDQARRALAVIDRQAAQLVRLVDDLLDVTRISRSKLRLQLEKVELTRLVRDTIEDQRSLFERAEVNLELALCDGPLFVDGDENRLAQVLGNLLQNAAKFTGRGGVTRVVVSADAAERRGVIRVSDTGVGMTSEMLSRLFRPFSQCDASLSRNKGGLGLGLALVKGLIELHGGDVTAHSPGPGQGSEFVVRIPLTQEDAVTPHPQTIPSSRQDWQPQAPAQP